MIQTNPDTYCRDLLQRHADGLATSTETRRMLAEALNKSGIAASVAGGPSCGSFYSLSCSACVRRLGQG
jgi:hypothetical protein